MPRAPKAVVIVSASLSPPPEFAPAVALGKPVEVDDVDVADVDGLTAFRIQSKPVLSSA